MNRDELDEAIERAKSSIKHPHFYYAVLDFENRKIIYKRKKWWKWLSGKREVCVKIKPILVKGLQNYENKNQKNK